MLKIAKEIFRTKAEQAVTQFPYDVKSPPFNYFVQSLAHPTISADEYSGTSTVLEAFYCNKIIIFSIYNNN